MREFFLAAWGEVKKDRMFQVSLSVFFVFWFLLFISLVIL